MVSDDATKQAVLFGGTQSASSVLFADTWTWGRKAGS
jgi:hypothetical protein